MLIADADIHQSIVQDTRAMIFLMLLADSVVAVSQAADKMSNSDVLIAHGVLSRNGKAGNLDAKARVFFEIS
jgi:hypothetical protein